MRVGLIASIFLFGAIFFLVGCGRLKEEDSSASTLSASGLIYPVLRSGKVLYQGILSDITDVTVKAYKDSNMTEVVSTKTIDCSSLSSNTVDYSLSGFEADRTYYLKASQMISYPAGGTNVTLYNKGTTILNFSTDNLHNRNIIMAIDQNP